MQDHTGYQVNPLISNSDIISFQKNMGMCLPLKTSVSPSTRKAVSVCLARMMPAEQRPWRLYRMLLSEVWFSLEGAPQGVKNAAQILAEANKKKMVQNKPPLEERKRGKEVDDG